ncbi:MULTISPECIES: universal stress protein [unclassified Streptomyces]|uniref:universal stress protein n=1 Tax=unclassified Streptomyces TaxID=2593676 RepID=UPI0005A9DD00|nr:MULTISPECIES: universal stress protein [unclassified Streptomyces]ODA72699.1 Universal stress protein [Streptomyces sp. AVP053U2]
MAVADVRNEILVGVDPKNPSRPALAWAAQAALSRGGDVRLLLSVPPLRATRHGDVQPRHEALRVEGEEALSAAVETTRALAPDVAVTAVLFDGMPAAVLCQEAAGRARLVVVGSRRLTRPKDVFSADSVVVPVSARAGCPVVVVRETEHAGRTPLPLVVGVDGSSGSRSAVDFAAQEAGPRGATVHAVWVWPEHVARPTGRGDERAGLLERRRLLAETVAGPGERYPDVGITQEVLRGHPVEELARVSATARAVVAGRHGRGGHTGMRLGSVVHGLLHRAECPVVVVPPV